MSEKSIIKLNINLSLNLNLRSHDFKCGSDLVTKAIPISAQLEKQENYDYVDETLGLYIGRCNATTNIDSRSSLDVEEFITILEGSLEVRDNKKNNVKTILTGESFVLPRGYNCHLNPLGPVRKFFIRFEPTAMAEITSNKNITYIDNKHIDDKHDLSEKGSPFWQQTSDGHRKKVLYQNHNKTFTCGLWQSDAFTTDMITFPYNEFIHITHGNLICRDNQGVEHTFSLGDAVFIPQGTKCAWKVDNNVSISFVQIK